MNKWNFPIPLRQILPPLAAAAILTLPPAITQGKYVWQRDIPIRFTVNSPQSLGDLSLAAGTCTLVGTGLRVVETQIPGQWQLLQEEGCLLPESFTLIIGETSHTVFTSGRNNPEGISFDPASGVLTIGEPLLLEGRGEIVLVGSGVPQGEPPAQGEEPSTQEPPAQGEEPSTQEPPAQEEPLPSGEDGAGGEAASVRSPGS